MSIMERYRKIREPFVSSLTPEANTIVPPRPVRAEITPRSFPAKYSIMHEFPVPAEATMASFAVPIQPSDPKVLKIALIGPPNAGKSSLMNALLKLDIASVSSKAHTTREVIRGILTEGSTQLVFIDCPGIIPIKETNELKELTNSAWATFADCDACLLVLDTVKRPDPQIISLLRKICPKPEIGLEISSKPEIPIFLVLNKIDCVEESKWLHYRANILKQHGNFSRVFFTSALKERGLEALLRHLGSLAIPGPWIYPTSTKTSLSKTDQVEQVVRSFLFTWFNKDVPYRIKQKTVGWREFENGGILIEHELEVADSVVARMVLGVRSRLSLQLSEKVQEKLQQIWGVPRVTIKLVVKCKKVRESRKDKQALLEGQFEKNGYKL